MPLYMDIHRNMNVPVEDIVEAHNRDLEAQGAFDVRYLPWFYNEDQGSIYCLVEAPSAEAAVEVHRHANGLTPDEIILVEQGIADAMIGADERGPAVREDPRGTVNTDTLFRTIVFTDLEGSTDMTQRLGDEAALRLLRTHDELLHACLTQHGGNRVKHTGDGMMASFSSVARAIDCTIAMQSALHEHSAGMPETPLRARIGVAAGEPVADSDDLFGAAVQLAARLCARAMPAQIVVAGVVRDLCIGKTFAFKELGNVELKGFHEPVRVYEVDWRA
jgi:class 3 adenylate cyclase